MSVFGTYLWRFVLVLFGQIVVDLGVIVMRHFESMLRPVPTFDLIRLVELNLLEQNSLILVLYRNVIHSKSENSRALDCGVELVQDFWLLARTKNTPQLHVNDSEFEKQSSSTQSSRLDPSHMVPVRINKKRRLNKSKKNYAEAEDREARRAS